MRGVIREIGQVDRRVDRWSIRITRSVSSVPWRGLLGVRPARLDRKAGNSQPRSTLNCLVRIPGPTLDLHRKTGPTRLDGVAILQIKLFDKPIVDLSAIAAT